MKKKLSVVCVLFALMAPHVGWADVLPESGDSWAREADPDATFAGDLISVWSASGNDAARRYGTVEFDLSGHADPITAAALSLFSRVNGFSDDDKPIRQTAVAIDPNGLGNADALSWNEVTAAAVLHTFGSLGAYDLPDVTNTPAIQNVYVDSIGTSDDVAFVESVRTGSQRLMVLLIADEDGTDYATSWGDGEFTGPGTEPLLLTNANVIPEPNTLALLLVGLVALGFRRRSAVAAAATSPKKS